MTAEKHHSNSPDDWIWKVIIMFITRRDLDITETLAYRVPFLCLEQVAAGWWPEIRTRHVLKRRLEKLIGREWLVCVEINLSRPQSIDGPLMVIDAQASWPSFEDLADILKSAAVAEAKPTKVVIAGPRAKNLFASDFADLPGILDRDRGYSVAAAFVWHKLHGMVSEHWLHRGDDARKMVNRTGWDALIRDEGTSPTSPIHSTAICCRPMSRRRWERLRDDAQQGWHRLEVW